MAMNANTTEYKESLKWTSEILEKKKDYQKRAKVFHSKENRIRAMKEKASMRNPDEFYFGMKNSVVGDDGRHRKTAEAKQKQFEEEIGRDTVRIMKDQDLSYVRMQKLQNAKKIDRLQSSLHFLEEGGNSSRKGKHIIFLSSKEEAEQFDVAKHFHRSWQRPFMLSTGAGSWLNTKVSF